MVLAYHPSYLRVPVVVRLHQFENQGFKPHDVYANIFIFNMSYSPGAEGVLSREVRHILLSAGLSMADVCDQTAVHTCSVGLPVDVVL